MERSHVCRWTAVRLHDYGLLAIVIWVNIHGKYLIPGKSSFRTRRLSSENIHSFWSEDYDQPKFVLLTSYSHSPKAAHFHKLLRRSVKNDTNCQVSVIDVDLFPGMAEYWKKYFGVDPSARPLLGYVALHNETALWMDQKQVNSTDGKESEMQNQLTVSDFITSILNGSVTLKTGRRVDPSTGIHQLFFTVLRWKYQKNDPKINSLTGQIFSSYLLNLRKKSKKFSRTSFSVEVHSRASAFQLVKEQPPSLNVQ